MTMIVSSFLSRLFSAHGPASLHHLHGFLEVYKTSVI